MFFKTRQRYTLLHTLQISRKYQLTGHNGSLFMVAPMESPRFFLSAGGDGWVARWDLQQPEVGKLIAQVETQVFCALYLPENNSLVLGNMNGGVHWLDLDRPERSRHLAHHRLGVFSIHRAGKKVFTLGGDGMLTRWDAASGQAEESLHLTNQSLRGMDYSAERKEIAVGASDNAIYLLDAASLKVKYAWPGAHNNSVFTVRYHPDGKHLLSGGRDAHLRVWSLQEEKEVLNLPAHWYTLNDIQFHPEGHWFATASRDKTVKVWDAGSFELRKVLEGGRDQGHLNSVNRLWWSPYENYLISASDDRTLIVWDIEK